MRLEELGIKFNLALDVDGTNRGSERHDLIHKLRLRRSGKIHARLRTEFRIKEINVVLDSNFLDCFLGKRCPFVDGILFVGIQPPPGATKQRQHNDE